MLRHRQVVGPATNQRAHGCRGQAARVELGSARFVLSAQSMANVTFSSPMMAKDLTVYAVAGDRGTILALADPSEHDPVEFRPNIEHVYFAVAELRSVYQRAKAAGCAYLEPRITRRPWGEKSFYARDPFGNPICFVDEKTTFTGRERREEP